MTRFFDPEKPIALIRWREVRPISVKESEMLRANGAFWMALAHDPFDKTWSGLKEVEVRNVKPWIRDVRVGRLVVLSRAYRLPHLLAIVADRIEYLDMESARASPLGTAYLHLARLDEKPAR